MVHQTKPQVTIGTLLSFRKASTHIQRAMLLAVLLVLGCGMFPGLDSGMDNAGPDCSPGQTICGDSCVSIDSDRMHCGACDMTCASGEVCSMGACALSCEASLTDCSGSCRDVQTDRAHCGACDMMCASGEVCSMGACVLSCEASLTDCSGSCRDVQIDRAHCGACGNACSAGEVCTAGVCEATSCGDKLTVCSGTCVDSDYDPKHCGACDNVCAFANASAYCNMGSCEQGVCDAGYVDVDPADGCEGIAATAISSDGGRHACALLSTGSIQCWGYNNSGQLGDGTTTDRSTPVTVSGITNAIAVSTNRRHTCALLSTGSIQCWGHNSQGQLGDGTRTGRLTPVTVSGITNATAVVTGMYHTCALLSTGSIQCWGVNNGGQLGDGTRTYSLTPVTVSGITDAIAVSAAEVAQGFDVRYTCALLSTGSIQCWGEGLGLYGPDGPLSHGLTPVTVNGITNATAISAGGRHACALLSTGSIQCWGYNGSGGDNDFYGAGQLGDGTMTDSLTPVTVSGITNAVAVSAGDRHTCALLSTGSVQCWGFNSSGQLGDGTTTTRLTPVTVSGIADIDIANAVAVSAGDRHTCALLSTGSIKCWGDNEYGRFGDATTLDSLRLGTVSGIPLVP